MAVIVFYNIETDFMAVTYGRKLFITLSTGACPDLPRFREKDSAFVGIVPHLETSLERPPSVVGEVDVDKWATCTKLRLFHHLSEKIAVANELVANVQIK